MITIDRLLKASPHSSIEDPVTHLVACHDRIEERLAILERAAAEWERRPEEARAAVENVFRYFETSGELHTADEEESVFPRLLTRLNEADAAYLLALEEQHREAEAIYAQLKASAGDPPRFRAWLEPFCRLYREHIASENERLVAQARAMLAPGELTEIAKEMRLRRGL